MSAQPDELERRYTGLYAGVVYDAMHHDIGYQRPFVVHRAIRPLGPISHAVLFGPAFTCRGQRVRRPDDIDDTVRLRMFQDFPPACIQVIDTDEDDSCAHFGEMSGRIARRFGCRGTIVDGYVRDARYLQEDGFPLYCRGIQPMDAYGRWQIVEYQVPIRLAGIDGSVPVSPGDFVFADADGVLVIPVDIVHEVAQLAGERKAREDRIRVSVDAYTDVQRLNDEMGRW